MTSQSAASAPIRIDPKARLGVDLPLPGVGEFLKLPRHHLTLRLTLVLLLFYGWHGWQLEIPLRILCGIALVLPSLTANATIWLTLSGTYVLVHSGDWFYIDNHKYLIGYWCIACTLAATSRDPDRVLRRNARLLIALCFTFATLWKVFGGEYFDGEFMHERLLTDQRFELAASWASGLDPGVFERNRNLAGLLALHPEPGLSASLVTNDRLRLAARVLSWWTLLMEASVAVAFWMWSRRLAIGRNLLLLGFLCTTYFFVPVAGFAFVLAVLGWAQCPTRNRRLRGAYLASLVLIELTRMPWQRLADDFLRT